MKACRLISFADSSFGYSTRLKASYAIGITTLLCAGSVQGAGSFTFNDATTQGWTLDQMYNSSSQAKFTPLVGYALINSAGTLAPTCGSLLIGNTNRNDIYLESPDLSANPDWQDLTGFSVDVTRNMTSPCFGDFPNQWFVQLQARVIDTADGNQEKLFAQHNGTSFVFHEIYSSGQLYQLAWAGWPLTAPQYIIKQLRLRIMGPGDVASECWFRGSWNMDNINAQSTAAPINDSCSGAIPLAENTYHSQNTSHATDDEYSACLGSMRYKGVWFTYTPAQSGTATADTYPSDFDTMLQVFAGDCAAHFSLGCNDDASGLQSAVTFSCVSNTPYLIWAGGYDVTDVGSLEIRAAVTSVTLENDFCYNAAAIMDNFYYTADTTLATDDGESPWLGRPRSKGVWYSFTPLLAGTVTVDTFPSTFDTMLEVLRGDCNIMAIVDYNDDYSGLQSMVSFPGETGVTYRIWAGGYEGASGVLNLRVRAPILIWNPVPGNRMELLWTAPYGLQTRTSLTHAWSNITSGTGLDGPFKTNTVQMTDSARFYRVD